LESHLIAIVLVRVLTHTANC